MRMEKKSHEAQAAASTAFKITIAAGVAGTSG
jgi:hypothetical protein